MAIRIAGEPSEQDADKLLRQIEAQLRFARAAIAGENEAEFRRAAILMAYDASRLEELVKWW